MQAVTPDEETQNAGARCPVDHKLWSKQKTVMQEKKPVPYEQDEKGIWHIRDFRLAREILRSNKTKQAGFGADFMGKGQSNQPQNMKMRPPILYLEGKEHQQMRKLSARYFAPKTVSENYRELMHGFVEQVVTKFEKRKSYDLSKLSMELAVLVAGEVVGLTDSRMGGMNKRLEAFFASNIMAFRWWNPMSWWKVFWSQSRVASFFYLDVKPAIRAREKAIKSDVISHLVTSKYSDAEILTECLVYGAAGMVTTREFISVVVWHLLENPALREYYLQAEETERHNFLEELLRIEPIVGCLKRRSVEEIQLSYEGESITIASNAPIHMHMHMVNETPAIVGERGDHACAGRTLEGKQIPASMMSFGDGNHRCPGSYIAIQETDIFLQRLLAIKGLRMVKPPHMSYNDLVTGYELRDFRLAID